MDESLLDFFAGQALCGLIAYERGNVVYPDVARKAYEVAEVMMRMREERNNAAKAVERPKR